MSLIETNRSDPRMMTRRWESGGRWGVTPVVKRLLIATVAIYLLQVAITHSATVEVILRRMPDSGDQFVSQLLEAERLRREAIAADKTIPATPMDTIPLEKLESDARRMHRELLSQTVQDFKVSTLQEVLQLSLPDVRRGEIWRLITYAFCHARNDISHLAFNMFGLFMFGRAIEQRYGGREFFLFYLAAAVASAAAYLALELWLGRMVPSIGASGSVMGILMLYTLLHPDQEVLLFFAIPVPIRWLCLAIVLYDLYPVMMELSGTPDQSGVAHAAHLGGLAFGYIYFRYQIRLSRWYDVYIENGVGRWFLPQARVG